MILSLPILKRLLNFDTNVCKMKLSQDMDVVSLKCQLTQDKSLRPEVAEVFMRKKTLAFCLGIPQVLLLMLLLDALKTYITKDQCPLLLLNQTTQFHFISLCLSKLFRCTSI